MSVYVDDMYRSPLGRFGRMKMSHMVADSRSELLAMADQIGLPRKWIQYPDSPNRIHFDVSMSMRAKAVAAGAVEITMREATVHRTDLTLRADETPEPDA